MNKIAIIGMGYVGLPLSIQFANSGVNVTGLDVDEFKIKSINSGKSYIKHIDSAALKKSVDQGMLKASSDFSIIQELEAVIICVPTPLDKHFAPEMEPVFTTAKNIVPHLHKGLLIILESTTYPGTTDDDLREILETGSKLKAGKDFHLAFSPEREDPGNPDSKVKTIPKIVGGHTEACCKKAVELYRMALDEVIPVSSCKVAEATKLLENIFRAVNIALVNELKMVYASMGIDIWEVIEAAKTKPFGFMPFYPGPGLGGHCIPIDPFYLTWKAREYGEHTKFIELAGQINTSMPDYVVQCITEALNDDAKPVKGSKILILGLAYKQNVDDYRESPSFALMNKLQDKGATVEYNDPFVPVIGSTRKYSKFAGKKSSEINQHYDLILIATAHDAYCEIDFSQYNIPVVDTRNCVIKKPKKYYKA